jgi:hypothetical protein
MASNTRGTLDRSELQRVLNAVVSGELSLDDLRAWLVSVIAGEGLEVGEIDNDLIWHVILGLDECTDPGHDEGELGRKAARYQEVLITTPDAVPAEALLWLAGGKERVLDQLRSYLARRISRSDFISAIQERAPAWPAELIQAMLGLSDEDLRLVAGALERDDYPGIRRILRL